MNSRFAPFTNKPNRKDRGTSGDSEAHVFRAHLGT